MDNWRYYHDNEELTFLLSSKFGRQQENSVDSHAPSVLALTSCTDL